MHIKYCLTFCVAFLVHSSLCKPTTEYLSEGRGVGSTLWGWITYPFSWWTSSELPTSNEQLIGPVTYGPYDNIEIAKRNVTVWCNDQTCTTMKCDKSGCKNVTCNIYDTDMRGECREYNTALKPEEPVPSKPITITDSTLDDKKESTKVPESSSVPPVSIQPITTQATTIPAVEERPLELEAVLSSTVQDGSAEKESPEIKPKKSSSPQNKV